ncbi:MAG: hypothetical protein ACI857_003222 [Arenicella sp.]|jgi:hypothetical protein
MIRIILILLSVLPIIGWSQFAPAANVSGTTAIHKDSSVIVNWANRVQDFQRGLEDISVGGTLVSFGDSTEAIGYAQGNSTDVVSLGDAGEIILGFPFPIENGTGPDFAIFENSFSHDYLELAHVEVSTDGINYVRMPSESAIQTLTQTGTFGTTLAQWTHNLAGKYIQGFGTPFDLEDIIDSVGVNLDSINYVKLIDVVGSINSTYGSYDALGTIINEPYPSAFESGGFDLDGVAVINENNIYASIQKDYHGLEVYPNPATNQIFIKGFVGSYELLDMSGKSTLRGVSLAGHSIDVSNLSPGLYILKTSLGTAKVQKR